MKKQIIFTALAAALAGSLQASDTVFTDPISQQEIVFQNGSTPAENMLESNQGFGTGTLRTVIGSPHFAPLSGAQTPTAAGYGYVYPPAGETLSTYWAQLDLPTGAEVDMVCLAVYDNHNQSSVGAYVTANQSGTSIINPDTQLLGSASTPSVNAPGYTYTCPIDTSNTFVIRTLHDLDGSGGTGHVFYSVAASLVRSTSANVSDVRFFGAVVWWKRTISPAPSTASFNDVPTDYWAFREIEALADSGITAGCDTNDNFCPEDKVSRAQMAVFLARALGLHWKQ